MLIVRQATPKDVKRAMGEYRATTWPQKLRRPPLLLPVARDVRHVDGWIVASYRPTQQQLRRREEHDDEIYLRRLHSLDLDDPAAICRFVRDYAAMGLAEPEAIHRGQDDDREEHSDLERFVAGREVIGQLFDPSGLNLIGRDRSQFEGQALPASSIRRDDVRYEQLGEELYAQEEFELPDLAAHEHLAERTFMFRLAARWIRDMTRVAVAAQDAAAPDEWESTWICAPRDFEAAVDYLDFGMFALLRPFSPRIRLQKEPIDTRGLWQYQRGISPYSAMAHQLAVHLEENATFRRCQNDRCGTLFVRQQGRSQYQREGRHADAQRRARGRIIYCTANCAKAQVQRNRRQRLKAAEREASLVAAGSN